MKFQTLSLVAGTQACNASCPFCISKATGAGGKVPEVDAINLWKYKKALSLSELGGVTTVIITGKGEPTLFPSHIYQYMNELNHRNFPFIELQTNGSSFMKEGVFEGSPEFSMFHQWRTLGMTTVMLSNVGPDSKLNKKIFWPKMKESYSIERIIDRIHETGLIVRFTTVGIKDGISSPQDFEKLLIFCKKMGIEQLTWRAAVAPDESNSLNKSINIWLRGKGVSSEDERKTKEYIRGKGTLLYKLVHGAEVYDVNGQNVCISTCLTNEPEEKTIRQLIFYPDGKLYTSWEYEGSRLL